MGRRMKLRVELIDPSEEQEIIVRAHVEDARVHLLQRALESIMDTDADMALTLGDTEYYVSKRDILFFETQDGKISAHTADHMYYTAHRLSELEAILPVNFIRVSKSCILNASAVSALSHSLTGTGQVAFRGTDKIVYVSRAYYKMLRERIHELRLS